MFGQWCVRGEPDLDGADLPGPAGVAGEVLVDATGAVGSPPACVAPALVEADADAAPAIPAAAPPVATAPATIVAPSIFEMRMRWNLLSWWTVS